MKRQNLPLSPHKVTSQKTTGHENLKSHQQPTSSVRARDQVSDPSQEKSEVRYAHFTEYVHNYEGIHLIQAQLYLKAT
jgi:hypothetical protein